MRLLRGNEKRRHSKNKRDDTHVAVGRWGAEEVNEILPLYRIGSRFDRLEKKRQKRIRSTRIVAIEIAQDGEGNNALSRAGAAQRKKGTAEKRIRPNKPTVVT